ncbi:MAG: rod shape-determining protein MreD [Candidatus Aminicenantes bacterium RBG_19FT_COMBO_65_30]|nr:MAG: rod shape-determining protein MreD [Candidatus Aminicenantes bacterium RBG_19FT_COMBO_65_30]
MRESVAKDVLRAFLATLAAVLVYSVAGGAGPALLVVLNAFSVVVLYFSVRRGEVFGALLGTMCGLVQDTFSLGVFGVAGLTKTLLGFWTGYISRRIDVAPFARNALFMLVMSVLEMALWVLITAVVRQGSVNWHGGLVLLQPLVTAVLGSSLFALERRIRARSSRGA